MSLSIRKALRKWVPYVAGVLVGVLVGALVAAIIVNGHRSTSACDAANGIGDGIILVLQDGQRAAERVPAETVKEKQRQQAIDFYNKAIKHIQDSKCR